MSTRIEITVAGTPKATPRVRTRVVMPKGGGKPFAMHYTPEVADGWKDAVRAGLWQAGRPEVPWTGPISLSCDVYFERPKYMLHEKYPDGPILHIAKPDRDNLEKAIMDALKDAGLMVDDCQVCAGELRKWYSARGCGPGVRIVAERIGPSHPAYCSLLHQETTSETE